MWLRQHGRVQEVSFNNPASGEYTGSMEPVDPAPGPDEQLVSKEMLRLVEACLAKVGERCRLLLIIGAEYQPREMPALIGEPDVSPKKISDDRRHCLKKLSRLLVERGISLT